MTDRCLDRGLILLLLLLLIARCEGQLPPGPAGGLLPPLPPVRLGQTHKCLAPPTKRGGCMSRIQAWTYDRY